MSIDIVGLIESDIEDTADILVPAEIALEGLSIDTAGECHPTERQ